MTLILDGLPADVLIKHPRATRRTYQFQVVDPTSGTPLDLRMSANLVSDIKVLLKVSTADDDSQVLLRKSLLSGGVGLSAGPGAILAANGWFDVNFTDDEIADPHLYPDGAQLRIGAKIYPQKQEVLDGILEIHGETVWT